LTAPFLDNWRRADPPFAPALCEPLIAQCARHLLDAGPGSTVADVGCGTGAMLRAFSEAGFHAIGIDADPAAGRSSDARLVLGDGERLPLRTGSVDALFAFSAFQYMDRERALAECSRVLKPGGRFAVVENLAGNPFAKLERAKRWLGRTAYPQWLTPREHLRWRERVVYERHFSHVEFEAHHVVTPLFLLLRALQVPAPPATRWNKAVLVTLRVLQRLERRMLAAGVLRGAAWHLVAVGWK
jgi:SAM-dependent methyltransferase